MNKTLKFYLVSLLLGIGVTVLTGAFLLTISLDMRWMSTFGIIITFAAAYFIRSKFSVGNRLISSVLMTIPYAIFFFMLVNKDLPSIWFTILAFAVSALLGHLLSANSSKKALFIGLELSLLIGIFLIIPLFISGDLTQKLNKRGSDFQLTSHSGEIIKSSDLKGKVVLLDFYGTWCKPCIYELPEIAKVRDHFSDNDNVEFIVVNSDQLGDTLEKAKRWTKRFDFDFNFAYDYKSDAYKKLGLVPHVDGAPALLILDQEGNIRLKHVGYNKSETDFVENMIEHIEELIKGV